MVRKTKAEARETREQILDAAERTFCRHGVARTSLHEIAESAGLTRGAVYWHFDDKHDLLAALRERCLLPLEEAFGAIDDALADDPLGRIREKALRVFDRIVRDERTRSLVSILLQRCEMVDEVAGTRTRLLDDRDQCLEKMRAEFRAAVRAGQLPEGLDAKGAALGLHALIDGLLYHWLLDPRRFALVKLAGASVRAYLAGLGAAPQEAPRRVRIRS